MVDNIDPKDRIDIVRTGIRSLYDLEYKTLKDLYGSSNDDADRAIESESGELPAYTSNRRREVRPYLQPTQFDDSGYKGLEPPVG